MPSLRRKLVSDGVLRAFRKVMPPMSQTEREALEAGTVWWDGELFSGRPDWQRLLATPFPALTPEEQRFLDEETADALRDGRRLGSARTSTRTCRPHVWQFMKDKGFLGMIIPKEYGGLGFSALRALAGDHQAVHALAARRRSR